MKLETGLDGYLPLSQNQLESYARNNHLKIEGLFDRKTVLYFEAIISARVVALSRNVQPLSDRDTYGKAFLQHCNLWTKNNQIKDLVFSKKLARVASDLLGVKGVRLYHDQALFKEGGGGFTPWHADVYYWPMATDRCITAWIPLQDTTVDMGTMQFKSGSHKILGSRDMEIGDESERVIEERLKLSDLDLSTTDYQLGDVSFHSGQIFHRAGENSTEKTRKVMTVIYMDADMKLKEPENEAQVNDWNAWCPGVEIGNVISSPINPVLYSG